jgi:thiosulfate dehydrogenase [quinone] large subunit
MNFSFMMAGSASSNPMLFGLTIFIILAWKNAGWWGLDRFVLPAIGTPWSKGYLLNKSANSDTGTKNKPTKEVQLN